MGLAVLETAGSLLHNYSSKHFSLDLTIIVLFVIGVLIIKHNNKARMVAIVLTAFQIVMSALLFIFVTIVGLNQSFYFAPLNKTISFKSFMIFGNVWNMTSMKDFNTLIVVSMLISVIPFVLLNSKKAEKEFAANPKPV